MGYFQNKSISQSISHSGIPLSQPNSHPFWSMIEITERYFPFVAFNGLCPLGKAGMRRRLIRVQCRNLKFSRTDSPRWLAHKRYVLEAHCHRSLTVLPSHMSAYLPACLVPPDFAIYNSFNRIARLTTTDPISAQQSTVGPYGS